MVERVQKKIARTDLRSEGRSIDHTLRLSPTRQFLLEKAIQADEMSRWRTDASIPNTTPIPTIQEHIPFVAAPQEQQIEVADDRQAKEQKVVDTVLGALAKAKGEGITTADLSNAEQLDALGDALDSFKTVYITPLEASLHRQMNPEVGNVIFGAGLSDLRERIDQAKNLPQYTGLTKAIEARWEKERRSIIGPQEAVKERGLALVPKGSEPDTTEPTPEEEKRIKIEKARELIADNLFLTESQRSIVGQLLTIQEEGRQITAEDYQAMMDVLPLANRFRLTKEIVKIKSTLTRSGTGIEISGVVDSKRASQHLQIDVSNVGDPVVTATSLAGSTTNLENQIRFMRIRSAEEIAMHRAQIAEKLTTGLTYDQIATEWKVSRETVMGDIHAVEREVVQTVLRAAAEGKGLTDRTLSMDEKEAALDAALNTFRVDNLQPLYDVVESHQRGSMERRAADKKVQHMRKHPTLTGLRAARYKLANEREQLDREAEEGIQAANPEQKVSGGVHLGYDEPPKFHRGDTPEQSFSDAGPGQGEQSFHEVFDRRNSRDNRFGR